MLFLLVLQKYFLFFSSFFLNSYIFFIFYEIIQKQRLLNLSLEIWLKYDIRRHGGAKIMLEYCNDSSN